MSPAFITTAYIAAALFFVLGLAGLSKQETAKQGNYFGIAGMALALVTTLLSDRVGALIWVFIALAIGAVIGLRLAKKVEMTAMPELIALLHSFVGLTAVFVGVNNAFYPPDLESDMLTTHLIEVFLGVFIGAVTFSGSIVAYGKLSGRISSAPLMLKRKNILNVLALVTSFILLFCFVMGEDSLWPLLLMLIIALFFGWHLVASIGGADMPVVISMLNSYSGWAAAAAGFMLNNDLLILTGALVGSSGAILSYLMCKAMNRSFLSVIMGGFGNTQSNQNGEVRGHYQETDPEETAKILKSAKSVVIVPGYGMAVAQAQYPVTDLTQKLEKHGVQVRFGIHPVAGRLPGHMNVLLAEAKVPYDIVKEMDEINDDFKNTDAVLVIGANDTVNPAASENQGSPISGMPVLRVWEAKTVIILKRGMNTGYAGVQNPLFYKENSRMLFGDAKATVQAIVQNID